MVTKSLLNAANCIVSVIGTATAETATGGAGTAISGLLSLKDLLPRLAGKTAGLNAKVAADINNQMTQHHLSAAHQTLIPQMIELAALPPKLVMDAARNPAKLADAMLNQLTDPAHQTAAAQDAFRRVVTPILTTLLADHETTNALQPAFQDAVAESLTFIGAQVEALTQQMQGAIERYTIAEFVVKDLARRFAPGTSGDFEGARRDLEKALELFATQQKQGALPSNHNDAIDQVFDAVNRLNAAARFDEAADALAAALAAEQEQDRIQRDESNARKAALLGRLFEQDRLRNNSASAAQRLVARLMLDAPADVFAALRSLQDEWYETGHKKGLTFESEVSIHLAEITLTHAQTADQRGAALNDLGIALQTLGEREAGTQRLDQAVTAYQSAVLEYTRDRVPLDWAATQNNLGNALRTLGEREAGTQRLDQAVTACQNALLENTRDRAPLHWAATQMNLGNALQALGQRQAGTQRLDQAVTAYQSAVLEYTRDRAPLHWATTQMNLGNALATLGEREAGTERLDQAVTAYQNALLERTRDRVPLQWAKVQGNLADLHRAYFDKTADAAHLRTALAHALAASEVFIEAKATHYIASADSQIAQIKARM